MIIEDSSTLFEIEVEVFKEWHKRPHKHNFFELVFIERGSGTQCINYEEFPYQAGNLFLLPPLDCHSFKIVEETTFYFIRFTDQYFLNDNGFGNYQGWFDKMAYILANYNKRPGDILNSDRERHYIKESIYFIHKEYLSKEQFSNSVVAGIMTAIINILARSVERFYVDLGNERHQRFGEILRYIHYHLMDTEKLKIPVISSEFNVSPSYFSEYFKKQSGKSLADYIIRAKLKLVETKVVHTDLTLKEIAHQLNFTDSSHLARTFKSVYGMTVKEYKKSGIGCCAS
ncbi:transcription regulator [Echinicola pacifica]|uniref:Transcription regulator n=1 Tax=Echinicola pacifica TaxID=346377 RepID=A0A918UU75_9BACT|nr:AraC family transcriptional regulator [Echinicola pacifica]GGZ33253.1 transcription regulator [Echinicola pacifica]